MPVRLIALLLAAACLLAAAPAGTAETAGGPDEAVLVAEGRQVMAAFMSRLKRELMLGLKRGGPAEALAVCRVSAPEIASQVSRDTGWRVGRTSLKTRNPANAPDAWEAKVMTGFQSRKEGGAAAEDLIAYEVVEIDGRRVFRLMQAIPTGGMCLNCHGRNLKPAVKARLAEFYPDDRATGFAKGDLRGAFTLEKDL